jgi:hypothetical protein
VLLYISRPWEAEAETHDPLQPVTTITIPVTVTLMVTVVITVVKWMCQQSRWLQLPPLLSRTWI